MAKLKLPEDLRPRDVWYRQCDLGVDLPSSFVDDLKGIDENLFPVWHQYRLLWEQIIQNEYSGSAEDPRHTINYEYGHLNFGFVLTDGDGHPIEEGAWHIWELRRPHGWGHICKLETTDGNYLNLFLRRLKLQADWNDRYGRLGANSYQKHLDQLNEEERERHLKERQEMMEAIHQENEWLINRAADNFRRGKTAPTNPMKETITSYSGQGNRSRIIRPLDDSDRESGIILPK